MSPPPVSAAFADRALAPEPPLEREVVERARAGEPEAFRVIFERHAPAARRFSCVFGPPSPRREAFPRRPLPRRSGGGRGHPGDLRAGPREAALARGGRPPVRLAARDRAARLPGAASQAQARSRSASVLG